MGYVVVAHNNKQGLEKGADSTYFETKKDASAAAKKAAASDGIVKVVVVDSETGEETEVETSTGPE